MDEERERAPERASAKGSKNGSVENAEYHQDSTSAQDRPRVAHQKLWRQCKPAAETVVMTYLDCIGFTEAVPPSIRGHDALNHTPTQTKAPAFVARVNHGVSGEAMGIVRVYLTKDGRSRAAVHPAQMMLGPCKCGAVWLGEPDSRLLIAIDIEDCLIAMQATGLPVWSALDSNGLRNLQLHEGIKNVTILAHSNQSPKERVATRQAALRWNGEGRRVRITAIPSHVNGGTGVQAKDEELREAIESSPDFSDQSAGLGQPSQALVLHHSGGAIDHPNDAEDDSGLDPTSTMIAIVKGAVLFHSPEGKAYAEVPVPGHSECMAIRGDGFSQWLKRAYYMQEKTPPKDKDVEAALALLEAQAIYDGPERKVFLRAAQHEGRIYLNLRNAGGEVVEINRDGWRIIGASPVPFRHPKNMSALPTPIPGSSIDELRKFINVKSDNDFVMLVSTLLTHPLINIPVPILALVGEQGTAKSTTARMARSLGDPNVSPLRALPSNLRDLAIAANNSWVLAFDNTSSITPLMSDALCRLATGGGFSTRGLYTDDDEVVFEAQRPVILTGIEGYIERPDLAERTVFIDHTCALIAPDSTWNPRCQLEGAGAHECW